MKTITKMSRMIIGSQLIIAFFTMGYAFLMLITTFFKGDYRFPILRMFDGKIDAVIMFCIGFLLIIGISSGVKKIVMPAQVVLCGIFLGYAGAYLAHMADGFPSVGLIAFICMFFLDFLTLLEVNPDE